MSYGWLSESTLAPKKAKSLNVPKGSISVLNRLISKHVKGPSSGSTEPKRQRAKDPFEGRNPGVELRNRVDRISQSSESQRIRRSLEAKSKLYESIVEGRVSSLPEGLDCLVDFETKREVDSAVCTVQEEKTTVLKSLDTGPEACVTVDATVNNESLDDIRAFSDDD